MKEILEAIVEAGQDDIKKGAGIGASVGLALSVTKDADNSEMLKNAAIGAGAGALFAWVLKEFNAPSKKQRSENALFPTNNSVDSKNGLIEGLDPQAEEK